MGLKVVYGTELINPGTLSDEWATSMFDVIAVCSTNGTPWVLDPAGFGATRYRTKMMSDMAKSGPTVIRGNASEIVGLVRGFFFG